MVHLSTFTVFAGPRRLAGGPVQTVVLAARAAARAHTGAAAPGVLVFEDATGTQVDFDLEGTEAEVLEKLALHPLALRAAAGDAPRRAGPGRPRLGVVGREITLLPRHWEWLERQPGGPSVTLRKLVHEASKKGQGAARARLAWEAAGRFAWAIAGNLPGFEEASRALYAQDAAGLTAHMAEWPPDVRAHVLALVAAAASEVDAEPPPAP